MIERRASLAIGLVLALVVVPSAAEEPCQVVVNAANPASAIKREALVAIFTGQMTRWKDNRTIAPVDQSMRSPVRSAFSEKLLGQSVMEIQIYWQRRLANGQGFPPPVKASDEEVVAYVRGNAGAIGYVSSGFALGDTVKAIKIVE
jgi:ABC-type phosphate transport system substrate-binding protein